MIGPEDLNPRSEWKSLGSLGRGACSQVYKVMYDQSTETVCKILKLDPDMTFDRSITNLENEGRILLSARHDNVVLFYGFYVDHQNKELGLIMKYCSGTTLYNYLHGDTSETRMMRYFAASDNISLTSNVSNCSKCPYCKCICQFRKTREAWKILQINEFIRIAKAIAAGMCFLHMKKNIVHLDLKSPNIFLDGKNLVPKIGDFGLATFLRNGENSIDQNNYIYIKGTTRWLAPELLPKIDKRVHRQTVDLKKADIYAFGVCLFEMITNKIPFSDFENELLILQLGKGQLSILEEFDREPSTLCFPDKIIQLFRQCCQFEARNRISDFSAIYKVFEDYDKKVVSDLQKSNLEKAASFPDFLAFNA